jgi:hypothetical protein
MAKKQELKYYIDVIWKGAASVKNATSTVRKMGRAFEKAHPKTAKFAKGLGKLTLGLNKFGGTLVRGTAGALAIVGGMLPKVFNLAEEGAAIDRTRQKLDALSEGIGTTANQMQSGLRTATQGAVSDLDLMRGAVTFLNMGFVDSQAGAEDLMQKILLLKEPTEDAQAAIENFSLMLANQSVARLDSFGLSSGRVKTRITELMDANKEMTREQAFTIATMEEMDVAIQRQGLSVEDLGNEYSEFKTNLSNATAKGKEFLNMQWKPIIGSINRLVELGKEKWDDWTLATGRSLAAVEHLIPAAEGADRVLTRANQTFDATAFNLERLANNALNYRDISEEYAVTAEQVTAAEERQAEVLAEKNEMLEAARQRALDIVDAELQKIDIESQSNRIVMESAEAYGASATAILEAGVATGELNAIKAMAIAKEIILRKKLEAIGEAYANGTLQAHELQGAIAAATDEVNNMPTEHTINIKWNVEAAPEVFTPTTPGTAGPGGVTAQHGANFVVPPGYPNDSFPVLVTSGEHVQVTPRGQMGQGPMIGAIHIDARGAAPGVGAEIADELEWRLAQVLGEQGRMASARMRMT